MKNSKIGHRNYAIVDLASLSDEEKEAVKSPKEYIGVVPSSYEKKNDEWVINYLDVNYSGGYTQAYDITGQLRFIAKGWLTCDEVSLLNKGKTTSEIRFLYKKLIFLEQQNENPWNLL